MTSQAASAGVGLIAATVFARVLGPLDFGKYFLGLTVVSVVTIATDLCVYQAILTGLPGFAKESRRWLRWSIVTATLGAIAMLGVVLLVAQDQFLLWLTLALTIPLVAVSMRARAFLLRQERIRFVAISDIVSIVMGNALGLLLLAVDLGVLAAAASQVFIAVIRVLSLEMGRKRAPREADDEMVVHAADRLSFAGYARHIGGVYWSQLAGFTSRTGDSIVVSALVGPAGLAFYSRAISFMAGPLIQAQMALNGLMIRDLSREQTESDAERTFESISRTAIALGTPPVIIVCLLGPALVEVLLGGAWQTSGELLRLSIGIGLGLVVAVPARWRLVAMRKSSALRIDGLLQLLNLVGVAVGTIVWGLAGAMILSSAIVAPGVAITCWALLGAGGLRRLLRYAVPAVAVAGVPAFVTALAIDVWGGSAAAQCIWGATALVAIEVLLLVWIRYARRR